MRSPEQKTYAIFVNAHDFFVVLSEYTSSNPFKTINLFRLVRPFGQSMSEILRQLFEYTHEKQNCNLIQVVAFFFSFSFFLSLLLSFASAPFQRYCCLESEWISKPQTARRLSRMQAKWRKVWGWEKKYNSVWRLLHQDWLTIFAA